jgi:hypothetical protein
MEDLRVGFAMTKAAAQRASPSPTAGLYLVLRRGRSCLAASPTGLWNRSSSILRSGDVDQAAGCVAVAVDRCLGPCGRRVDGEGGPCEGSCLCSHRIPKVRPPPSIYLLPPRRSSCWWCRNRCWLRSQWGAMALGEILGLVTSVAEMLSGRRLVVL